MLLFYLLGGSDFFGKPWLESLSLSVESIFKPHSSWQIILGIQSPLSISLLLLAGICSVLIGYYTFQWFKTNTPKN